MKQVIKLRLYPSKSQKKEIFRQLDIHKNLYNYCLEEKINKYKSTKESISCYDQIKTNVKLFKNNCNVSSLQQTIRKLDKSFNAFFLRLNRGEKPGFPRFKGKIDSIEYIAGDGAKLNKKTVYFQHVGEVKCIIHRNVSTYSRIILSYKNEDFYACFIADSEIKTLPKINKNIGLDFGLKIFITTSDGEQVNNPKFHKQKYKQLSKLQSKRDKLEKGTLQRKIKNKIISKYWKKIRNLRHDFNHKLANKFIQNYDLIALERLKINNLQTKIKNINRTYSDVCWNQFTNILSYKAENAGKKVVFVNPAYTSQKCSNCGKIQNIILEDRQINCVCGLSTNRDLNAARNILALGLQCLA